MWPEMADAGSSPVTGSKFLLVAQWEAHRRPKAEDAGSSPVRQAKIVEESLRKGLDGEKER